MPPPATGVVERRRRDVRLPDDDRSLLTSTPRHEFIEIMQPKAGVLQ